MCSLHVARLSRVFVSIPILLVSKDERVIGERKERNGKFAWKFFSVTFLFFRSFVPIDPIYPEDARV